MKVFSEDFYEELRKIIYNLKSNQSMNAKIIHIHIYYLKHSQLFSLKTKSITEER